MLSLRLIEHGRQVCDARKPALRACARLAGDLPVGRQGLSRSRRTGVTRGGFPVNDASSTGQGSSSRQRRRAVERAAGGGERPLGREQLARDRGVGRVAVALGQVGDPAAELVDLRADARQQGEVARGAHRGSCATRRQIGGSSARGGRYDERLPMLARSRSPRHYRRPARRARATAGRGRRRAAAVVATIVADVRARGDAALRELHRALRRLPRSTTLAVPDAELDGRARRGSIADAARRRSSSRATRSSRGTRRSASSEASTERLGVAGRASCVVPVDRAGCYVPGGRAPLASSVLMTALPGPGRGRARGRAVLAARRRRHVARRDPRRGARSRASTRCTASAARRRSPRWRTAPSRSRRST